MSSREDRRFIIKILSEFYESNSHKDAASSGSRIESYRINHSITSLPTISTQTSAEERNYQQRKHRFAWLSDVLLGVAAGGTLGSLWLSNATFHEAQHATREAHNQAVAAKEQTIIAKSALENGQRAFIIVSEMRQEPDGETVRYIPIIKNSGLTIAADVSVTSYDPHNSWQIASRAYDGTNYVSREDRSHIEFGIGAPFDPAKNLSKNEIQEFRHVNHVSIAPNGGTLTASSLTALVSRARIPEMLEGKYGRFIFGFISYKDVFANAHISKYCFRVDTLNFQQGKLVPNQEFCSHWNCADEDCESDKASYYEDMRAWKENESGIRDKEDRILKGENPFKPR